jgi:hypothetical protein
VRHTSYFQAVQTGFFIIAGLALLWLGRRNQPDPLWRETAGLLQERPLLLYEQPDSLQHLFCTLHGVAYRPGDSSAWRFVAYPHFSTIEWGAFSDLAHTAANQRFIVVAGVTGAGATKYSRHLGRLLAGRSERLLEIDCAPQFDLEYHKKYIGFEEGKRFNPGVLLEFWDRCRREPRARFAVVLDNFDKINPETFFGPALWEALGSRRDSVRVGNRTLTIPENFHLISVVHHGPGALTQFNQEHYKRLGRQYVLKPNLRELRRWLEDQKDTFLHQKMRSAENDRYLAALQDTAQLHRYLYFFAKTNQQIEQRYGGGYLLGQGSNARQYYRPQDAEYLKFAFINHINALQPANPLRRSDFEPVEYTLEQAGLEYGTSFFARQIQFLQATGYLVEISMLAVTALLTALASWWLFRRRERLVRRYVERAHVVFNRFEQQELSADAASLQLDAIKKEVDSLVMGRRLHYFEALYFLAFIDDKAGRIESARNVSANFLALFNAFMEDEVLTENEYQKLMQFLHSIRYKIPEEIYRQYCEKVQSAYHQGRN